MSRLWGGGTGGAGQSSRAQYLSSGTQGTNSRGTMVAGTAAENRSVLFVNGAHQALSWCYTAGRCLAHVTEELAPRSAAVKGNRQDRGELDGKDSRGLAPSQDQVRVSGDSRSPNQDCGKAVARHGFWGRQWGPAAGLGASVAGGRSSPPREES